MLNRKLFVQAFLGLCLATGLRGADQAPFPVPKMREPAIDGKLSPGEWDNAAKKYGFGIHASTKDLGLRQGFTMLGYDRENLYLAIVTELPPDGQKLRNSCSFRDGEVVNDDGIELWLSKDSDTQYQIIVNGKGVFQDSAHTPSSGMNPAWNSKMRFSSGESEGNWVCEMAIPLSELGIEGNADGKTVRFFAVRNWKQPWIQAPFAGKGWAYSDYLLSPENPSVRIDGLGKLENQFFSPSGTYRNNSSAEQNCAAELKFTHSDMPEWSLRKEFTVRPGETIPFEFEADAGHIHLNASHNAVLTISADGKELFRDSWAWKLPRDPKKKWEFTKKRLSLLHFAHYPYLREIRFHLNGADSADRIEAEIRSDGASAAKKIFENPPSDFTGILPTGELKDGTYELCVTLFKNGKETGKMKETFERTVFPWEHNTLGITREVIEPFEKITYPAEREMKMSLKTIGLTPEALYSSLKLEDRELLAGPARYLYSDAQGESGLTDGKAVFTERSPDRAVCTGTARGRDFTVETKALTEYDGCTRFELTLAPEEGKTPEIGSFRMEIPLDSKQIRLLHVIRCGTIRSNPARTIPEGEGEIWKSTDTPVSEAYGNMHIYLWLGEMSRGISWFADNDKNFSVDDIHPVQQLIRKNGVLTLRVNFVNKAFTLKEKRTIVFGMQPSPTRPMPENWRSRAFTPPMHGGSNGYWGINAAYAGKYPVDNDWTFADKLLETRRNGTADHKFVEEFLKKHYAGKTLDKGVMDHYRSHFHAGQNMMESASAIEKKTGKKTSRMLYFEEHCQDQTTPEWRTFQDEWDTSLYSPRTWLRELSTVNALGGAGIRIVPSESYRDFTAWHLKKWAEHGLGTYYDNTFPRASTDTVLSSAYVRENGSVQPSACLWEMREYHKRTWILTRLMNRNSEFPIQKCVHMTNGMILPIVAWTDINLDLEWSFPGGGRTFPPELLEIESTGRQNGAWPHILYSISPLELCCKGPGHQNPRTDGGMPTEWAMRAIYDILPGTTQVDPRAAALDQALLEAGYADPGARVFKYWEPDYPVSSPNPNIRSTLVVRGKHGFFIAASWSARPEKADFRFSEAWKIEKAERISPAGPQPFSENGLETEFVPFGYVVIQLEFK